MEKIDMSDELTLERKIDIAMKKDQEFLSKIFTWKVLDPLVLIYCIIKALR
jgi:hypothetical protein